MPAKKPSEKTEVVNMNMPNSPEAEQNVLCCILRDADNQAEIVNSLCEDDFYTQRHAIIFRVMKRIVDSSNLADMTSVIDGLRLAGQLAIVGDVPYIIQLNDTLPGTANFDEYVAIVKRASTMRKLINVCAEVQRRAFKTTHAQEVLTYAEEEIFKLSQGSGSGGGLEDMSEIASRTMFKIGQRFADPQSFKGIETGFKQLDKLTNGFRGGEFVVLAARPSVGKSAMAMNIVEHVAKAGKSVAVFSLEMSNEQLVERMLSSMAAVPMEFVKSGQLPHGTDDLERLRTAQETISSQMLIFSNENVKIRPSEIASQCRVHKNKYGLDLVVIDYIQLMIDESENRTSNRQEQVANISRALKTMAKQLDVPVLALAQLKREAATRGMNGEKGSSEPVLSDLRESGAIEQDADIVMFIHRYPEDQVGNYSHSLIVAKNRSGDRANIPLHWIGKFVRFVDDDYLASHNITVGSAKPAVQANDSLGEAVADAANEVEPAYVPAEDVPYTPVEGEDNFEIPEDYDGEDFIDDSDDDDMN